MTEHPYFTLFFIVCFCLFVLFCCCFVVVCLFVCLFVVVVVVFWGGGGGGGCRCCCCCFRKQSLKKIYLFFPFFPFFSFFSFFSSDFELVREFSCGSNEDVVLLHALVGATFGSRKLNGSDGRS